MPVQEESRELDNEIEWFLDYLAVERGASKHTVSAYASDLRQFAVWWANQGHLDWSRFTRVDATTVRAMLGAQKLSANSMRRKVASLRSFLKFLSRNGELSLERLPDAKGIRKPRTLPKALTRTQVEELMAVPNVRDPAGLRDRAMFELLYGAGLRISELTGLRMENYDDLEALLRIVGKRGKTRVVPIPAASHVWLRKYLDRGRPRLLGKCVTSHVFLNVHGKPISRSGVFRILRAHAATAGIPSEISPHTLRHTYAVHLVQGGADLRAVQELLGHASVATTEVYTHLDMETVRQKYIAAHPRAK